MSAGRGRRVAVVGAGWSGLAAAVACVSQGDDVTLLEAGPVAGGRARTVELDGLRLDNGQHLFLGAYTRTLALMRRVGADPQRLFERRRLDLTLADTRRRFRLRLPPGPDRLMLATALLGARGLAPGDRLRALAGAPRLARPPCPDRDVEGWLAECRQPPALRERLWRPLCLAALNVPAGRASARVFARVLDEAFAGNGSSDLLLARTDLGALLPDPALAWLRTRGAAVHLGRRVRGLASTADGWTLETAAGPIAADAVVLAIDPTACARLLPRRDELAGTRDTLGALGAEPITTVYLRYPAPVRIPEGLLGRLDTPAQWLFDRSLTGHPGVIAAVISGSGPHDACSREALQDAVAEQVARARPDWPAPSAAATVRERRATFSCTPGSDARRLPPRGPVPGLWFAGDHVATGLPATLEGAVRAGEACAAGIHDEATNGRAH